ncbi:AP-4 complex accessory subunit tepsin isoform X34 [Macaca fascicularis]|uniref:AP-4 complex accessory subunit tepsin isoform X34 n=1 Tax=Macaca fascicularis TaxID=9541 RepID=UPI003D15C7D8
MRPGPESPSTQRLLPRGDTYQPATMPSANHGPPTLGNPLPGAIPGPRAMRHQPGQAGGGWDELDSSPSSQNSSQNSDLSRVSDSGSHSGSDSHSGASREPGDLAERVEVVALSDCQQELSLVRTVTRGPCAFLSREEAQHFLKACGLLNCEAVLQLLTCHLRGTKGPVCHCLPGERRPPSPGAHPPPHPAAAAGAQHGQPGTCDQQGHQGGQLQSATHTRVQGYSRTYTAVHGHPVPARRLVSPSRTRLPSPRPAGRGSSSESGSSPPQLPSCLPPQLRSTHGTLASTCSWKPPNSSALMFLPLCLGSHPPLPGSPP